MTLRWNDNDTSFRQGFTVKRVIYRRHYQRGRTTYSRLKQIAERYDRGEGKPNGCPSGHGVFADDASSLEVDWMGANVKRTKKKKATRIGRRTERKGSKSLTPRSRKRGDGKRP